MTACDDCGAAVPEGARFCPACGARLATGGGATRKTVTAAFVDLVGWTPFAEERDPEASRHVQTRFFDAVRGAVERHGGTVEKYAGDSVLAVFGIPAVHEDDGLRALRAMREALDVLAESVGDGVAARAGVESGVVVAGDPSAGQRLVTGDAVNIAARLQSAAAPGDVVVGPGTAALVRGAVTLEPLGPLELKGKSAPVTAWRLESLEATDGGAAEVPLVGRDRELVLLRYAFEQSVGGATCHLFTLLGAAGVGKSRLATEFCHELGDRATLLRGHCLPYGEGITFWPLRKVVEDAAAITDDLAPADALARIRDLAAPGGDAEEVASLLGAAIGLADAPSTPEETFWAARRLFESLARERPLVVVLDDLHWAEPTFLDLVEHVAEWSRGYPILLLCMARPELVDVRSGWGGGKLNATSMLLEPLDDSACRHLIEQLVGDAALASSLAETVCSGAEGNPLFVEEMLAMLGDDGTLERRDGRLVLTRELGSVDVPPTINALLAARLDRLTEAERTTLQRGAVVGKTFSAEAVIELCDGDPDVRACLDSLVRKELLRPEREGGGFRFRHILVRDAAYGSVPKELRAQLHERFAARIDRETGARRQEYDEIVGYHLERAAGYLAELHLEGADSERLADAASTRLGAAGTRALARGDLPAAANLLDRAASLLGADDARRHELTLELVDALVELGEFGLARGLVDEVGRASTEDPGLAARVAVRRTALHRHSDPESVASARSELERAILHLAHHGDHRWLARAFGVQAALCASYDLKFDAATRMLDRALHHAEHAGDERERTRILSATVGSLFWGSMHADEAIVRTAEIRALVEADRASVASCLVRLAGLRAMRGRFDEARSELAEARALLEEVGFPYLVARSRNMAGIVELLAGDFAAAERELRTAVEELEAMGERGFLATAAALLAHALTLQHRPEEAEALAYRSEELGGSADRINEVLWRTARARALLLGGRVADAEELARVAAEAVASSDDARGRGDALVMLAEVLAARDRADDAARLVEQALVLYEQKGVVPGERRARVLLSELGVPNLEPVSE